MLVALVLSASLGASEFSVEEGFTTSPYSQGETSLSLNGPFVPGEALFGYVLASPQDWSKAENLSLNVAWVGGNPGVFFNVTLFDDEDQAINIYQASTISVGNDFSLLPLQLTDYGSGNAARFSGLEIRWNGVGEVGSALVIESLVGSAGPIAPVVTSTSYAVGEFTLRWSGTGALPVIVQRRESLQAGQWTAIAQGVVTGQYTDTDPPAGAAFYRVVVP